MVEEAGWIEDLLEEEEFQESQNLDEFGVDERAEIVDDAVVAAIHDQTVAGLDVITDGEQTRPAHPRGDGASGRSRRQAAAPDAHLGDGGSVRLWRAL